MSHIIISTLSYVKVDKTISRVDGAYDIYLSFDNISTRIVTIFFDELLTFVFYTNLNNNR